MDIDQEFTQKYAYILNDIKLFNKKIEAYKKISLGMGCRLSVMCLLPCCFYTILYPMLVVSSFMGSYRLAKVLYFLLPLPLLMTCCMLIFSVQKQRKSSKGIKKHHLVDFRNKVMRILYEPYEYSIGEIPREVEELQNAKIEKRSNNIIKNIFDFNTILPYGIITYMGQLKCGNRIIDQTSLYELAVDYSGESEKRRNCFHGIVGILEGWESWKIIKIKSFIKECEGEIYYWDNKYVLTLPGISFDQFMHFSYGYKESCWGNPFNYRLLEKHELEENYKKIREIINLAEEEKGKW